MRRYVVLPGDLVAAIDHLVGKRGRSSFLKQAAWEEVKRQQLLRLLENPEPIWKVEDHPELQDGAEVWVDRMRAEDERLDRRRNGGYRLGTPIIVDERQEKSPRVASGSSSTCNALNLLHDQCHRSLHGHAPSHA